VCRTEKEERRVTDIREALMARLVKVEEGELAGESVVRWADLDAVLAAVTPAREAPTERVRVALRRMKSDRGLSVRDLAATSGVDINTISRFLRGRPVHSDNLDALAILLEREATND
jgi:DNA-binding Xre family transcriptional regulator